MKKRVVVVGILILILIGGLIYFGATRKSEKSVNKKSLESVSVGNLVRVEYTGSFENGSVFDTSDEAIARKNGLYDPLRAYEPIEFEVGSGQMISGFDKGVLGMKIGEKKRLVLSPEDAYGEYDPSYIESIPRIEIINRTFEINRTLEVPEAQFEQVFGEPPEVGKKYSVPQIPWEYNVTKAGDTVVLQIAVKKGEVVNLSQMPWSSEIIEVGSIVKIRHNPKQGQIITTAFGNATVNVTTKEIIIRVNPVIGAVISTPYGQSVVKEFNATSIILDMNHPLAGKTLIFNIEILNISEAPEGGQQAQISIPSSNGEDSGGFSSASIE